jgi:hypothetical protein
LMADESGETKRSETCGRGAPAIEAEMAGADVGGVRSGGAKEACAAEQQRRERDEDQNGEELNAERALIVAPGGVVAEVGAGMEVVGCGDDREEQQCKAGKYNRDNVPRMWAVDPAMRARGDGDDDAGDREQPSDVEELFQATQGDDIESWRLVSSVRLDVR